jgi:hypothetical protein
LLMWQVDNEDAWWLDAAEYETRSKNLEQQLIVLRRSVVSSDSSSLVLDKDAPEFRQAQPLGEILALLLGGLHHYYVRVLNFRKAFRLD